MIWALPGLLQHGFIPSTLPYRIHGPLGKSESILLLCSICSPNIGAYPLYATAPFGNGYKMKQPGDKEGFSLTFLLGPSGMKEEVKRRENVVHTAHIPTHELIAFKNQFQFITLDFSLSPTHWTWNYSHFLFLLFLLVLN